MFSILCVCAPVEEHYHGKSLASCALSKLARNHLCVGIANV